jgi:hypothetical protein
MLRREAMAARFVVEHVLQASEEQFWTHVFRSERFNRALYIDHLGFGYELESWDPATCSRRARIWPVTNVPKALSSLIGGEINFVEEGVCDEATRQYDFSIIPSRLSDRIDVRGRVETEPLTDRTCRRRVTLDIEVRMFGIGPVMESFLERSIREQYDENAAFIDDYLAGADSGHR